MSGIIEHTTRRKNKRVVQSRVKELQRQLDVYRELYKEGLPAETSTLSNLEKKIESQIAVEIFFNKGRLIDLRAIASQQREDGMPMWSVVDPRFPVGTFNGNVDLDGDVRVGINSSYKWIRDEQGMIKFSHKGFSLIPEGIPPIPPKVRDIISNKEITSNASILGLLFQPTAWLVQKPDPALIVQWYAIPDKWFCLAVWGQDKPGIMEFVD